MRSPRMLAVVFIASALASAPVWAVELAVSTGRIVINHRAAEIRVEGQSGRQSTITLKPGTAQVIFLRSTEQARVLVEDPNPLLFRYAHDKTTETDNANFQQAAEFAEALTKLGGILGNASEAQKDAQQVNSAGARAATLQTSIDAAVREWDNPSLSSQDVAEARADLRATLDRIMADSKNKKLSADKLLEMAFIRSSPRTQAILGIDKQDPIGAERFESAITSLLERMSDATLDEEFRSRLTSLGEGGFFDTFKKAMDDLTSCVRRIPKFIKDSAGDTSDVARLKNDLSACKLDETIATVKGSYKKLDDTQASILNLLDQRRADSLDKVDARWILVQNAQDLRTSVTAAIASLEALAGKVALIDQPTVLTEVAFSESKDRTVELSIDIVKDNALVAEATKRVYGKFTLVFKPWSPVLYKFGGALIYSFVEVQEFTAKKIESGTDAGKFTITRTENGQEYLAQNVAATMTITPRRWSDPQFGAHFLLGVTPKKDEIGWFGGVGLRFVKNASITAGWTYQQVKRLTDGLRVGDVIDAADKLKTKPKFESGWFLALGLNF